MKAIVCPRWGEPDQVLEVRDVPEPVCGTGQVRVRMLASPVNPSDLFMIRGQYGHQPPLPCIPGFEGVGVVEEWRGVLGWRVRQKRVAVLNSQSGNWAEQVVIPARQAVPIPDSLTDEQAATYFVNPASALVMTRYVLQIPKGAYLLQTAAGSALGRMVIRLGRKHGFHTINVVRRREQADELLRLGGDAVIVTPGESIPERVREITKGKGVPFAIDAVGGETGSACVEALGSSGRLLLYSTLSGEPIRFASRALMTTDSRIEGFWLSTWSKRQNPLRMLLLFGQINKLMQEGIATSEIGASYSMEQVHEAVRHADRPGHSGKVLLRIGSR